MKIVFISMPSVHFIRWIENIENPAIELYWFDVLKRGELQTSAKITQFTNWQKSKMPKLKGKHFLSKKAPSLYEKIEPLFEVTISEKLNEIIAKIQPDVIHSFEMQSCSYPILKTLKKHQNIKWIYSCWGSDLYYYQNFKSHKVKLQNVLKRIDFLHSDCLRDYEIAKALGFSGSFLGVIPGGGGYDLKNLEKYCLPFEERNVILVKGYEHQFGRAINVIKALIALENLDNSYEVVIFGAHQEVIDFVSENNLKYKVYGRTELSQTELIEIMGKSLIYIGNSVSDGVPNTLLEAIIMQAFPIQSNPGNATAELIEDKANGLLINNPNDILEIKEKIAFALSNLTIIKNAMSINHEIAVNRLNYAYNQAKINNIYSKVIV